MRVVSGHDFSRAVVRGVNYGALAPARNLLQGLNRLRENSSVNVTICEQQVPPLRYAPVGMTIHQWGEGFTTELSSRPERSVVEGPAVFSVGSEFARFP
jgi:hypothetical protein